MTVASEILTRGYTTMSNVLDARDVGRCLLALEEIFAAEDDIAVLREWKTPAYRVAYMLPAKHEVFLELCRPSALSEAAATLLGADSVIAGFNGLDMRAGGEPQPLHRDHPVPTPGVPLYLHAVIALDAFTAASGATRIVPASHLDTEAAPPFDRFEDAVSRVLLVPGDAVLYDAACIHAGSANRTATPRRALHVLFARRWVLPRWDFRGSIRERDAAGLDEERRRLLGFGNTAARYDHERAVDLRLSSEP